MLGLRNEYCHSESPDLTGGEHPIDDTLEQSDVEFSLLRHMKRALDGLHFID